MSSSTKGDPRRPENIVPYHIPKNAAIGDYDWAGTLAMVTAMGGMFLRLVIHDSYFAQNRFIAVPWVAAFFGLTSFLNTRTSKKEESAGFSGAALAFVSLFTYYMNVYIMSKRAASAGLVDVDVE
ncbi:hypothetical protein VTP01DRAFT_3000 [Rhizomucor pusillus]|uniref:uncharacterized protein n=1 Tax=Rhizomucor pusillus TaxID=4840 RepID=UPI003741F354